jgi:hypothetical protein
MNARSSTLSGRAKAGPSGARASRVCPSEARATSSPGRLEGGGEAGGIASGRADGAAGKKAAKVDNVEPVIQVCNIALQAEGMLFLLVELEASRDIDR